MIREIYNKAIQKKNHMIGTNTIGLDSLDMII